MTRLARLVAALAAALMLGATAVQPALAATPAATPTPTPTSAAAASGGDQQLSLLEQQLKQQQATVNSLATQVESEQAAVNTLNSKVSADKKQETLLDLRMDRVARIEYERPALSLTTILDARNLGQLLSGVAQARLVARQQRSLFTASEAVRAKDQGEQAAAKVQLTKISKQKSQASTIAATTEAEITTLQNEEDDTEAAASTGGSTSRSAPQETSGIPAFTPASNITLQLGASDPNRFDPGQCTWYVAEIYQISWLGNADQWPSAAAADGQLEGQTPEVGAIMESADSSYGHVSVVISVADDNDWTVTEMNYLGSYVTDTRQVSRASSNLVTFIY